jgi:DNA repair exonuclease SbcCD ATPase subunit
MQEHYTLASQEFTDLDREGQQLERAQRLLRTAQEHQARVDQLQLVAQRMEQYNQTIATISQDIDRRELLLAKVAPWVAQATQTLRLVEARQLLWDQLDNYSYAYEQNKQYQEEALQRLAHLQADYATCLQESGTCPMCGVRVAEGRHEG